MQRQRLQVQNMLKTYREKTNLVKLLLLLKKIFQR